MDFTQLQDRVRLELLRRIERGTVSVSLLARQTGVGQPHISNFLHGRRGLSLRTLDLILAAQHLDVADLLPARREAAFHDEGSDPTESNVQNVQIPLVPHAVAIFEPYMRTTSAQAMLPFPSDALKGLEARCSSSRKHWDRFVAVRIGAEDARAMEPVLQPEALVVLDRHYTSFNPYREGETNLYAARLGSHLVIRYAQFQAGRVVLRAHRAQIKADVLEPEPGETANDLLVGRVVLIVNRLGT
jgi:transcriptional regulator with XRE-family HTH domain